MERHFFMISRALNARKRKIFALFFALAAVVTSAMAQEESLLTTLTFGGSETYGETTSGVVSATATNVNSYNGTYGWLLAEGSSLSVTAKEGYTITKCVFRQNAKDPITDTEAPFEIHTNGWGGIIEDPYEEMNGVTSIEVYGYANAGGGSAATEVIITQNDFPQNGQSFTKDGVTVSAGMIDGTEGNLMGGGSFSTTLGNFTKIEVTTGFCGVLSGTGWSGDSQKKTWTGNASSVSFSGEIMGMGMGTTLKFTIEAAAPATEPEYTTVAVNGVLPGVFSVGASTYVRFSQGNLQFTRESTDVDWSTGNFSFMDNQYDYIENSNVSANYADQTSIGLFGWATSNINTPKTNIYNLPSNTDATNVSYGSEITDGGVDWATEYANYDWGANTADLGTGWRTLTKDEWVYLLNTRTVNGGTGNGKSYTLGQSVNGTLGIVLYPDNYTGDIYAGNDWSTFEAAGCVFLPAAGNRSVKQVGAVGSSGYYWSSSSASENSTFSMIFNSNIVIPASTGSRYNGYSVRLVYEDTPQPYTITLPESVSIVGTTLPEGITDKGEGVYEVVPSTEFQIQAAVPEHYNFVGWSDLDTTDPNYSANPRTVTINSDLTIKPLYALEAFTITLTSNDTTMGKVTLRAGSGGGEDGDMSIANNADLEGANTSRNIAVGADGSIHVVYKSTEDESVKYIKSIDGITFTEPVTVANGARECEVAVSSNGKVYVSYYKENDGGYIAYSADGTSFTSVMVDDNAASIHLATDGDYVYGVNMPGMNFYYSSDGGQTYNMHSGWSGYMFSDVMVDPLNHNVVVIKDMPEVVVRYSTNHGATFTEEAPVMVQGGNDQLAIFFSTATMGDGKVYMAGADAFVAIIDYKTATCTKTDVNLTDNRSLCADPVGNVIVGVEQNESLYYQLSTNSAVSFGDKVLVSNGSGANAALNYHDGTLLYLFTKDNKLYLATRTGIVPTESVVDNGDGTYAVQYGTEVTFTAKAKPGYHVESWSNAVEVNDIIVATQTLEVNSAMTIGATFAANPILTIATNDSTKGIVSLEGAGGSGQGAVAAEINPDMAPQSWQGDETLITVNDLPGFGSMSEADALEWGLTSAIEGMCKLIYAEADGGKFKFMDFYNGGYSMDGVSFMDRDRIYSTLSEGIPVYYAIGGEAIEGIIDLGGGQYSVVPGTELTFVAKPAEEHYLVSWNDEPATSDTLKLTMTEALAVNASFAHVPYIYTLPEGVSIVEPMPAGSTAKGNGVYEIVEGTEFQISADIIPEHYHFDHWADLADSVAMYAANPRMIVAGENLTIEPIFAIDTYTLTLATNDSTKGVVSVIGAGSGAGAGVGEMIELSEKQTENPVMGEYFQVAGEGVNYQGRIIGRSDDYQLTISSQNGEKLDFIILKVSSKGLWSGYTVSSTAGDVEDLLDNFTVKVSNINATSVTISRSGTTANPQGYIIVSNVYVNEEIPLRADITDRAFPNSGNVLTGKGVTLTAGSFDLVTPQIVGGGTFTTDLGNFTKIEIYAMRFSEFSGEGWTEEGDYARVWTGKASSVSFDGAVIGEDMGSIYIGYTIAPASAASGIVDNGDGTYTVDWGTELTFVAKPAEGFMLESWSNGAAVTSDTLKLTMTEELSLTANFKHIPATITLPEGVSIVEPMPAGITSKGEGVYEVEYGTEFQISADIIPEHYHFDHWADLDAEDAMYAANPRTIVADKNLTIEPIFAIDTYIVTLASNDSTMGTLRVEGAGGSNIGPREEINIYHGVVGEHYQVLGEYSGSSWIGVGGNDNKTITVESLNGEIIDNITLEVYMPSHWTGYSIAATSGNVSGDVANYQDLVITNINATSVTLSRVGEGENGGSVLFSEIIVNGRDAQQGGQAEPTTVTWTSADMPSSGNANSFTLDGVTITCGGIGIDWGWKDFQGNGTFTTDLGNFTKIEVNTEYCEMAGDGWSGVSNKMTWTGNAASVSYNGSIMGCLSIVFTIEPAAPAASGIVDNGDGTYTVDWGTEMSIIAEPKEGYMLASWNGEPALSDTLKQTVEGALSINATFKHIPAVITLPEGVSIVGMPIEGITSKGEGVYEVEYGTEFQISADIIPEHHHFGHWADLNSEDEQYAANPRTIVAGENLTIEPIFAIDTYTLTLATNDSTKGVVSVIGAGQGGEPEPSAQLIVPESWSSEVGVTITAADLPGFVASTEEAVKALPVPTEGSVFVIYNFKDDGGVEAVTFENGEYVRTTSTRVDHANASYYSNQGMIFLYTTAAGQAGQGGEGGEGIVDNGDGTYTVDWGTELTFTAKAADGYHVQSWSNGAEVNDLVEATQTITMTEALDLSALFAENPIITLATNDSTMGIVTLAGAGKQLTVAGSNMDVNQNIPIRPVSSTDTRTMNQSIYPVAMLTGIAGNSISGMTYYISEPGAHVLTATYVVKLMETEQAAFSDAVAVNTESATTVYTGTIDVTGNTLDIVFDQPYAYNGGNLLVEFSISSASHQNALAKFSVFASQGGSFQQYYNFGFEEMRYYTYDFLAKTTFICGDNKGIPGVIDLGNGQYNVLPGTELTFVAQPAKDYHLVSWNGEPAVSDTMKVTVTEEISLSAQFKHDTYILTVEGAEVETAKFADGTIDAVVLNPGTLVGVVEGDSVKLTTTATYNTAAVGNDLTITLHYAIEVVEDGIYNNEYALAITDSIYQIKGAIIEPMTPDEEAATEDEEAENKEGLEIYAYGYCHGSGYSINYYLKSGNPNQYKIDFADTSFVDVPYEATSISGREGTIDIEIPVDLPTGDYSMTVTFRDSNYTWLESEPITVSFHVNLPETYVVALFDNVMAVVDTCECLTDIQWYWRANSTDQWTAIEGATGYYYKQEGGLSGEFFIKAKMNGIDTYTCPQEDLSLYGDTKQAKVSAYPNPVQNITTVTIEGSNAWNHTIRIVNLMGNEMMTGSFEGNETTIDMSGYTFGNYMISVDGIVVKVIKK